MPVLVSEQALDLVYNVPVHSDVLLGDPRFFAGGVAPSFRSSAEERVELTTGKAYEPIDALVLSLRLYVHTHTHHYELALNRYGFYLMRPLKFHQRMSKVSSTIHQYAVLPMRN